MSATDVFDLAFESDLGVLDGAFMFSTLRTSTPEDRSPRRTQSVIQFADLGLESCVTAVSEMIENLKGEILNFFFTAVCFCSLSSGNS
jgi:hypothetical protein